MIERKIANALALDYPRELLEVIVASDGSADRTVERAGAAGADLVLDLPAAARSPPRTPPSSGATGEILAFSDANCSWAPGRAARGWSSRSPTRGSATSAARSASPDAGGGNQEGAYWRYEMAVRAMETRLAGITAGNGAIYAVRREAYIELRPAQRPRPLVPVRRSPSGAGAPSTSRRRAPRRRWRPRSRASSAASGG